MLLHFYITRKLIHFQSATFLTSCRFFINLHFQHLCHNLRKTKQTMIDIRFLRTLDFKYIHKWVHVQIKAVNIVFSRNVCHLLLNSSAMVLKRSRFHLHTFFKIIQINFATGPGLTHKTATCNIGLPELQNSGSKFLINHLSRDMTKPTK